MKPTLLVMAAGLGSRYGGVKQIDAVFMMHSMQIMARLYS